jgi:adenylosuccinate synthase
MGQWGDEGKGKIVDWLRARRRRRALPGRAQCRPHAGHRRQDLQAQRCCPPASCAAASCRHRQRRRGRSLAPAGRDRPSCAAQGVAITPDNLRIAENAPLILPLHRELDGRARMRRGGRQDRHHRRGIGPAYEDKVGRRAIRVCDLADPETLDQDRPPAAHHNALRAGLGRRRSPPRCCWRSCWRSRRRSCPMPSRSGRCWTRLRRAGKRILFEGAQARCSTSTTAPIPSSPRPTPWRPGGGRLGPRARGAIGYVLGIAKAYTTRVGEGPFPTELTDEIGERLGERGHEFGTVTGRKRRCGWFDAVLVRQAVKVGGIDGIALTKLDVLDGLDEIKICTGYELDGKCIDYLPAAAAQARSSRSTRRWRAGRKPPGRALLGRAAGARRSSMCAASRN